MNRLLQAVEPNIDKFGYITQADGDGGDTVLHEADFVFVSYMLWLNGKVTLPELTGVKYRYIFRMEDLEQNGVLRRHVDNSKWYGQWNRMSRDQAHSIIGIAAAGLKGMLNRFYKSHALRGLLFTNNYYGNTDEPKWKLPDVTLFGFWTIELRCAALIGSRLANSILTLLAPFTDLGLLAQSCIRKYIRRRDWYELVEKRDVDTRNHLKALILSKLVNPTWASKRALHVFGPAEEIKEELRIYFRPDANGVTGLGKLWCELVDEVWK